MSDKKYETDLSNLPFRSGVGMMIINRENKIFIGKRVDKKSRGWQMPQGGIDLGETPSSAAMREMYEETGTKNGRIIAESKKWYAYRVPLKSIPKLWEGRYCGQKQKWFLIEFLGLDSEINLETEIPEFQEWKWVKVDQLLKNIIPFKFSLYKKVVTEFAEILKSREI